MNKTFVTNTHIAPIVDVSTYEGPFSYDNLWSGEEENELEEGRVVCWDYDSKKLGERLVKEANKVFEAKNPLAGYGVVEIRATKFGSPREYNFTTDWLDLSVKVDESFFDKARTAIFDPKNRKTIVEHCKDHWVSYDGFTSFMLNRVQNLSLNRWEHEHYGRHMSTDEEVETAVLADLQEVLTFLETGTSEDEHREFGAILALLWRFEYPGDFDRSLSESWSGSWVTDLMDENLRDNSSISEFCTVLDKDEIRERFGVRMVDFDERRKEFKAELDKYRSADFEDKARIEKICELFVWKVERVFNRLENTQLNIIATHATGDKSKDGEINDLLYDFQDEVEERTNSAHLSLLWREASHGVQ